MTEALLLHMDTARLSRDLSPLLCCAQTNAATDNILEGLAKTRRRVVRIGQPAQVLGALQQQACPAHMKEGHAAWPQPALLQCATLAVMRWAPAPLRCSPHAIICSNAHAVPAAYVKGAVVAVGPCSLKEDSQRRRHTWQHRTEQLCMCSGCGGAAAVHSGGLGQPQP